MTDIVFSHLIGQKYTTLIGEYLREQTLCDKLRVIRPKSVLTCDYNLNRINVTLDAKDRITEIHEG